jgi:hypothetical protein
VFQAAGYCATAAVTEYASARQVRCRSMTGCGDDDVDARLESMEYDALVKQI